MSNVYVIRSNEYEDHYRQKLNVRLTNDSKVKGIYFSLNTKAINGGVIYFLDRAIAEKHLAQLYDKKPEAACRATIAVAKCTRIENLCKVSPGLHISKKTDFYKTILSKV